MKNTFPVLTLAIAIVVTKIVKRNFSASILVVAIILSLSVVSFTSFGKEAKNGTVLGITLGKSLSAVGLQECRRTLGTYSFKEYDNEDTNCYQINDDGNNSCFTRVMPELSFDMRIDVFLLESCDRESPVQEIRATFGSGNYERVLPLMIGKFGQPKKTEKSVVQNGRGIKAQKIESYWDKRGFSMYLTNIHNETDLGLLQIIGQNKKRSVAQRSQKEMDRKIF